MNFTTPPSPPPQNFKIDEIKIALKNMAKKMDYLYDFNPETYLQCGDNYYKTRKELIKLENKYYVKILEKTDKVTIQMKKFIVCDDVIDEEPSSWVDEKVVFEMNIDTINTDVDSAVNNFLELASSVMWEN